MNWLCDAAKSAAYTAMGPLLPGQPRLKPPPGLSEREREIFGEVIASLSDTHLAAEDLPLVTLYVRGLVQCELAAQKIAEGSTDRFWLELQAGATRNVNQMAVRLRIGPKARSPANQRRPGSALSAASLEPPPWAGNPGVQPRAVARDSGSERNFADLLPAHDRGRGFSPPPRSTAAQIAASISAIETSDRVLCLGAMLGTPDRHSDEGVS